MSKLLINEPSLQVLPSLAAAVGLNEAIVLQQIHYWVDGNKRRNSKHHFKNDRYWCYNTIEEWRKQFPFWSERTIRRTIDKLRESGLVIAEHLAADWKDRTLWYTIDYEKLQEVEAKIEEQEQSIRSDCPHDSDNLTECNNRSNCPDVITENTQRIPPETADAAAVANADKQSVVRIYENEIGSTSPHIVEQINAAVEEFGSNLITQAMQIAVANNVRTWAYVRGILDRWRVEGRHAPAKPPPKRKPEKLIILDDNGQPLREVMVNV